MSEQVVGIVQSARDFARGLGAEEPDGTQVVVDLEPTSALRKGDRVCVFTEDGLVAHDRAVAVACMDAVARGFDDAGAHPWIGTRIRAAAERWRGEEGAPAAGPSAEQAQELFERAIELARQTPGATLDGSLALLREANKILAVAALF